MRRGRWGRGNKEVEKGEEGTDLLIRKIEDGLEVRTHKVEQRRL